MSDVVEHFDILTRMCEKNLDIRMSLAKNITNMKTVHKGRDTNITIGINGNVISQILNATHNGSFLLWDKKQYYATKAEMEKELEEEGEPLRSVLPTLQKVLRNDLSNAVDNVLRAEAQQKRMPFDHDNNDALERYKKWRDDTTEALRVVGT